MVEKIKKAEFFEKWKDTMYPCNHKSFESDLNELLKETAREAFYISPYLTVATVPGDNEQKQRMLKFYFMNTGTSNIF